MVHTLHTSIHTCFTHCILPLTPVSHMAYFHSLTPVSHIAYFHSHLVHTLHTSTHTWFTHGILPLTPVSHIAYFHSHLVQYISTHVNLLIVCTPMHKKATPDLFLLPPVFHTFMHKTNLFHRSVTHKAHLFDSCVTYIT